MTDVQQRQINPVEALVLDYRPRFEGALVNKPMQFDSFLAAVLSDCVRQPKLMEAARQAPETMLEALMVCANAGLMPGGAFDQFYLIPRLMTRRRGEQRIRRQEVTFITGYKGLCTMAYRHPRVHAVEAFLVYKGEEFDFDPGAGVVRHKYSWGIDRSDINIVGGYSRVVLTDPSGMHVVPQPVVWPLSIDEILAHRAHSQAWQYAEKDKSFDSPWHLNFAPMCRKTLLRSHLGNGSVPRQNEMLPVLAQEADTEEYATEDAPKKQQQGASLTEELLKQMGEQGGQEEDNQEEGGEAT